MDLFLSSASSVFLPTGKTGQGLMIKEGPHLSFFSKSYQSKFIITKLIWQETNIDVGI